MGAPFGKMPLAKRAAGVEMPIAAQPPYRSGHTGFPHLAPTSGDDAQPLERIGMTGSEGDSPARDTARPPGRDRAMSAAARPGARRGSLVLRGIQPSCTPPAGL